MEITTTPGGFSVHMLPSLLLQGSVIQGKVSQIGFLFHVLLIFLFGGLILEIVTHALVWFFQHLSNPLFHTIFTIMYA